MAIRFKTYLPRSLVGRAALILMVPIITIQLVVSVVFIQRHYDGVTRQLSRGVSLELHHLVRVLEAAPTLADAQQQASALGQDLSMQISLPAADPPPAGDRRDCRQHRQPRACLCAPGPVLRDHRRLRLLCSSSV